MNTTQTDPRPTPSPRPACCSGLLRTLTCPCGVQQNVPDDGRDVSEYASAAGWRVEAYQDPDSGDSTTHWVCGQCDDAA